MDEVDWSLSEEIDHMFIPKNLIPELKSWLEDRGWQDENFVDSRRRSALMLACSEGEYSVADSLIQEGADVDHKDMSSCTPLMIAVEQNHEAIVQLLLRHNANVDATNEEGCNALFLAARHERESMVKLLLQFEDKVHISAAVLLASQLGLTHISDLILRLMTWWPALIQSSRLGCGNIMEACAMEDSLEPVDSSYSSLMIASILGHGDTVEALLKDGSDINQQNAKGWTALMFAASFRHRRAVELLLLHRAEPNLYTMEGKTALQLAAYNGYTEIVQLLCQNGADVDLAPYCKFSPLILAASNGHIHVVETLFKYKCNANYKAPITEKIELRQKPGQGRYERRMSETNKKYLQAVDFSIMFGFSECTQVLQQKSVQSPLNALPEVFRFDDEMGDDQCEDESIQHTSLELCSKYNKRHGVFLTTNEVDTIWKIKFRKFKSEDNAITQKPSSLSQDDDSGRVSASSEEGIQDINTSYVRELLDAYSTPNYLRVVKCENFFYVYFNHKEKH